MEVRQLRYFTAVAEAGSFSAAASMLHMSQPPLSLAIAQLERELGVQLLQRSSKGVRVTGAGAYLLEAGYRILDDISAATANLGRYGSGHTGRVTIATVPSLMWSRIPGLLRQYERSYPDVEVRVLDPGPLAAIDMVLDRSADLAFVASADTERLIDKHAGVLKLAACGELGLRAVFPPQDADLPEVVDLTELTGRPLFIPRRTLGVPSLAEVVEDALTTHAVTPSFKRTVTSIPSCLPLVAAGLGAAILPELTPTSAPLLSLCIRRIAQPLRPLQVGAIWRKDCESSPALDNMRRMAIEASAA